MSHKIFDDTWILYQISLVNLKTFLLIRSTFANFYRKTLPSSQTEKKDSYYNLLYKHYGSRNIEYLCKKGFIDGVRWLQENPLGLVELTGCGMSFSIYFAAEYGHLELVKYLVNSLGITLHFDKYCPIQCASKNGHIEVVKFLSNPHNAPTLEYLDPSRNNNLALYSAIQNNHFDIVKLLLTLSPVRNLIKKNICSYIPCAAQKGHLNITKLLLEEFLTIIDRANRITSEINRAIYTAAAYGHLNIIKYLSNIYGADASYQENAALRYAAQNGHLKIVKFLTNTRNIPALKNIDASDGDNYAICAATKNGHMHVVNYLSTLPHVSLPMYYEYFFKMENTKLFD